MIRHRKTGLLRRHARQIAKRLGGNVSHSTTSGTQNVIVPMHPAVVSPLPLADLDATNPTAPGQQIQVSVHSRKADAGRIYAYTLVHFVSRQMNVRLAELGQNQLPLPRHARSGGDQVALRRPNANASYYHQETIGQLLPNRKGFSRDFTSESVEGGGPAPYPILHTSPRHATLRTTFARHKAAGSPQRHEVRHVTNEQG